MKSPADPEWDMIAIYSTIAFIGGCLGYTARTMDANKKFSILVFFFEGLAAGFFGFLMGIIIMENGVSLGWGGAAVGVLSWLGARTMLAIIKPFALNRAGLKQEVTQDEKSS